MARKLFEPNQIVEVQREVNAKWEPAGYLGRIEGWKGWHKICLLEGVRYINSTTGMTTDQKDTQAYSTTYCSVPTRRIRRKVF